MSIHLRSAGSWTLGLLCLASPVAGQNVALREPFERAVVASPQTSPNTYGTTSDVVYTVWASEFQIVANGVNFEGTADGNTGGRRCASGSCIFLGAAHLPNGAAIKSIELEACDNSTTNGVAYALFRAVSPGRPSCPFRFQRKREPPRLPAARCSRQRPSPTPSTTPRERMFQTSSSERTRTSLFPRCGSATTCRSARLRQRPRSTTCRLGIRSTSSSRPSSPPGSRPAAGPATTVPTPH